MGAIFILVTALRASLLGRELNLLSDLKGNTEVWLVLKRKLSSRSWFLRTRTKHLHHLKSWILSGWQRRSSMMRKPCRTNSLLPLARASPASLCSHEIRLLPLSQRCSSPMSTRKICLFSSVQLPPWPTSPTQKQAIRLSQTDQDHLSHPQEISVSPRPPIPMALSTSCACFCCRSVLPAAAASRGLTVSRFVGYSKTQLTWTIFYCGCWLRWGLPWSSHSG